MKKILVWTLCLAILTSIFCIPSHVLLAAERQDSSVELPYPGIFADHPLYFLKDIRDKVWLLLIRENDAKADLLRHLADKKVSMAEALTKQGKWNLAVAIVKEATDEMNEAVDDTKKAQESKQKDVKQLHTDLMESNTHQYDALVDIQKLLPAEFASDLSIALSSNLERAERLEEMK